MAGQTVFFKKPVYVEDASAVVGKKEKAGPLGNYFENVLPNDLNGQKTHEKAEVLMHTLALKNLKNKLKLDKSDIDLAIAGDLLDEIVGSSFTMREMEFPYMGIFNACATFAESMIIASSFIEAGLVNRAFCSASSHFCTAERQYRNPLELGCQRTPLSQWTVTASGAVSLVSSEQPVAITSATIGQVVDYGVSDANNMGGAMAPAARDTLISHFKATGTAPKDYDLIVTGDLGHAGSKILKIIMEEKGYNLGENYTDCGILIFNKEAQNVMQGGSGAGCSASVFAAYIYKKMLNKELKKVLFCPTGALISKTASLQKETIPGICHAVSFEVK